MNTRNHERKDDHVEVYHAPKTLRYRIGAFFYVAYQNVAHPVRRRRQLKNLREQRRLIDEILGDGRC